MNTYLKRSTLLLSTALGLLLFPGAQAWAETGNQSAKAVTTVGELIVTAQKREESSLDVPMGLTALSGKQLESQQAYTLEDFVGQVPGLTLTDTLSGTQLVIRGIAASYASVNAPVATYIDDTPIVGIGPFSGGSSTTPNIDTFDMNRIEVLKGPQGTLYGADALGGILKYVTNAPDPSGFHTAVEAGVSTVANGGQGYDLHGMINLPLAKDLAFRIVGYDNYDPGYIDDPLRGLKDINTNRYYGGRAALLWTPTANFSIRLNALYQWHSWGDLGGEDVNPGTFAPVNPFTFMPSCNLCQERYAAQPGKNNLGYYNGTINWDLGWARLMSSTTYYNYSWSQDRDLTVGYGGLATSLFPLFGIGPGPWGFWAGDQYHGTSWVEEARLSSKDQGPFQWQAGAYYTSKTSTNFQNYFPINLPTKTILYGNTIVGTETIPATYQEVAGYANVDYHITPTFDVAVGGRYSYQSQTFSQQGTGTIDGSVGLPQTSMNEDVFTYSGDARWHFTPGSMLYARIASGFVPGGPNDEGFTAPVPPTYGPSKTIDYEVGLKSSLLDDRLTIDVDAYEIDWRDIQLVAVIGGYGSLANGGTAKSQGVEWNVSYVPVSGLTLDFNGDYDDARLTQDTPASVGGKAGQQLPVTPRWQSSASANYERPLFGAYNGFVGINWRYAGSRFAEFEASGPRNTLPSYQIVDLRAGIKTQRWTLAVYVKNVGNAIGINYITDEQTLSLLGAGVQSAFPTTPRTVGAEFTADF